MTDHTSPHGVAPRHTVAPRHAGAPRSRRGLRAGLITTALVLGLGVLGGGSAYAVWSANATVTGGELTAGDLNVQHGAGTWAEITPGVSNPASGSLDQLGNTFTAMPGDVLELTVPFQTYLQGENLSADLQVDMGTAISNAQKDGVVTASYRIETSSGELVAPATGSAALGESVTIDGLDGTAAGVASDWVVVVTVTVGGDYRWSGANDPQAWQLWGNDGIQITLEQVREGSAAGETGAE